jgi:Flp pilus assembly protein TadB
MIGLGSLISFATSPVGKIAAIGLAVFVWTAYQRDKAADSARAECQAAQMEKTIAEITRQRDAAKDALREAEARIDASEKEMDVLKGEKDAIMAELADRGATSCVVPDDIIKRLRNIR